MKKYPLEPGSDDLRRMIDDAARRVVAHIESLPRQPTRNVDDATDFARSVIEPLPKRGEPFDKLLDFLFEEAIPRSFNTPHPGYLAYIPGGGIVHSAIADFIATAVNRYVGVFAAAPVLAQLEANVTRWFCEIVGYGKGSGGLLTPGGSVSNLIALITARKTQLGDDFARGTLYAGNQIHHSFQKAASLAGFSLANVREIDSDEMFRVRVDAMEEAIARDRAQGFKPFLIAGSAGTVGTGAVDDLAALADLADRENMWFHVDGAYGAFFVLTDRGRAAMRGIERADSVVLDPHKTLFHPYGTGALVVRRLEDLRATHSMHASYLPQFQQEEELIDFAEISPELSRDFRGLRVWLPLKMFGIEPFRELLDEKLDLARWATAELRNVDGIEIVAEPQLSIVAFRHTRIDNRRLLDAINRRKRVMMTGTTIGTEFVIRICVVSHRTHMDRMRMAIDDIRAAVAELA
ncbi:MAG TPA: aminotransferase class V-fold PLP-dependent enzyme [Thermoanaerobaculia bacterium]|nr:aminotransferase class V-fold PLP-dependent enzyme [Thermoanaerobaculia bacterium]